MIGSSCATAHQASQPDISAGLLNAPEGVNPFGALLREAIGNEGLVAAVSRIEVAVDSVVEAWCASCTGPDTLGRQELIRSHGKKLLGELGSALRDWQDHAGALRFLSGAQVRVLRPGIVAFSENGALQIGLGEIETSVRTRKEGGVTQIGTPSFEGRDALRTLGRLMDQLSEAREPTAGTGLTYHPDAKVACREYSEAVSSAVFAISCRT